MHVHKKERNEIKMISNVGGQAISCLAFQRVCNEHSDQNNYNDDKTDLYSQ